MPLQQIKATSDRYGIDIVDTLHKHRGQLLNATATQAAITQARQQGQQEWQHYKATELTPDETQLIAQVERQLTTVEPLIDRYLAAIQNGSFLQQNNSEFNRTLYDTFDPLTESLDHLITLQLEVAGAFTRQSEQQFDDLFWLLIIASSLLILILIVIGTMMYRSINQPIHELRTTIREIAQHSDLSRIIDHQGNDEISHLSQDFSQMISSFQRVIQRLRDAVAQSSTAAEEMSAISNQVSQTVKDQEAQVIAVATAITEMSGAVKEVANNANQTSNQATDADEKRTTVLPTQRLHADIAQSVGRIADMNFQVSTATEEQSQVANEINENISRFSLSLADVAQSAEQSALASQEIARLSVDLQQQVSQFKA